MNLQTVRGRVIAEIDKLRVDALAGRDKAQAVSAPAVLDGRFLTALRESQYAEFFAGRADACVSLIVNIHMLFQELEKEESDGNTDAGTT